ncbi:MAG TPA: tetratricopeptide repeat protein [Candidatus Acidoferrales bacterium]|nr:tetratricopeptide repeat protein [Candidatus Acidoferrales bacterium]
MKIPDPLISQLRHDLVFRRIQSGFSAISANRACFNSISPEQKNAAVLLGSLAQWVDIGFDSPQLIKKLLKRFPKGLRSQMSLADYVHLCMAEGFVAMQQEEFEQAICHFQVALSLESEIGNKELVAIANFSIGRCHRRAGRYRDALTYVVRGKKLALELQYPVMAAVMQIVEAWIAFQEERNDAAMRILKESEQVLSSTDDYVSRGNIQSAFGRIARRQGKYQQALQYFESAINEYNRLDPRHRNVARSLVNIASAKRLIALQLRARIDSEAARWQRRGNGKPRSEALAKNSRNGNRASLDRLHREGLAHLADARKIYSGYHDHRGTGAAHINCGYLFLDQGNLDAAASEAETAYRVGEEKRDRILQARARILQSAIESARFEEGIDDGANSGHPAQAASDYAREALEFANATQSRRLVAKAYLTLAHALSNGFFNDLDAAHEYCDKAAELLCRQNQDYVWRDLQDIKRKLVGSGKIDSALRQWSKGVVGEKSFQQISEDFAGILIPRVWKREGCKISRVAERLSISPKKIRRILRKAGLLNRAGT